MTHTISDYLTNALTLGWIAFHAALLAGYHDPLDFLERTLLPPPDIAYHFLFWGITIAISLSNIFCIPRKVVRAQWEQTMYGDKFFPGDVLSIPRKRQLCGGLEMLGIVFSRLGNKATFRSAGFALLSILYGRGALIHGRIDQNKMLFALGVSLWAAWLGAHEFRPPMTQAIVS